MALSWTLVRPPSGCIVDHPSALACGGGQAGVQQARQGGGGVQLDGRELGAAARGGRRGSSRAAADGAAEEEAGPNEDARE